MSNQSITLSLPEAVMRRARRTAEAARRPSEDVLTATLVAALPEVEGAPPDMQEELARMTCLDEQTLWAIAQSSRRGSCVKTTHVNWARQSPSHIKHLLRTVKKDIESIQGIAPQNHFATLRAGDYLDSR